MSVKNNEHIHSNLNENVDDEHILNRLALSHTYYLNSKNKAKPTQVERFSNFSNLRKRSLNVFLPSRLSKHTDSDLKLMWISLKNAQSVSTVHIVRIERELMKRGCSLSMLRV